MADATRSQHPSIDVDLCRFSYRSFQIGAHAELWQGIRLLSSRARSEIQNSLEAGTQVLDGEIESSRVADLPRIVFESWILAPGMKLGHGNGLIRAFECKCPIGCEVNRL